MTDNHGDPSAELVEVVDEQGEVLEVLTRREVRERNLRHRCTYVAVVTSDDQLVVHQRAAWKDVYPSYWDVCFGGVTDVGEEWEPAARRELAEEAGLSGIELERLGPVSYEAEDGRIVGRAYVARHNGELTCPDGEVVAVDRIPLADLEAWMIDRPICPDSKMLVLPLILSFLTTD